MQSIVHIRFSKKVFRFAHLSFSMCVYTFPNEDNLRIIALEKNDKQVLVSAQKNILRQL